MDSVILDPIALVVAHAHAQTQTMAVKKPYAPDLYTNSSKLTSPISSPLPSPLPSPTLSSLKFSRTSTLDSVSRFSDRSVSPLDVDETEVPDQPPTPVPQPPLSMPKSLIILDWDDTLFPTTFLAKMQAAGGARMNMNDIQHGLVTLQLNENDFMKSEIPAEFMLEVEILEKLALRLVAKALRFGNVVIITNAEDGWIHISGSKFMPKLLQFIYEQRIQIVSARSCYEPIYPYDPMEWKIQAFMYEICLRQIEDLDDLVVPDDNASMSDRSSSDDGSVISRIDSELSGNQSLPFSQQPYVNVISIGDGISEREAAHVCRDSIPNLNVKTVKFVESPKLDQLQRQVVLVESALDNLMPIKSSFDINLVA